MARTPSNMLPLGTKAPDFELLDTVSDNTMALQELTGEKGTVAIFVISVFLSHC